MAFIYSPSFWYFRLYCGGVDILPVLEQRHVCSQIGKLPCLSCQERSKSDGGSAPTIKTHLAMFLLYMGKVLLHPGFNNVSVWFLNGIKILFAAMGMRGEL